MFHTVLLNNVKQNHKLDRLKRHIYTFSDCAYIIYDEKEKTNANLGVMFDVALRNCEPLLMKFLSKGLVFRGGITYGNIFYSEKKNMFFGEAINKAYEFECKVACFPRIIVDDFVAEEIKKFTKEECARNKAKKEKGIWDFYRDKDGCIVQKDTDSRYYLNFFNSLQQGCDYSPVTGMDNLSFLQSIIDLCTVQIKYHKDNDNIRTKYEWLKKYALSSRNPNICKKIISKRILFDYLYNEDNLLDKRIKTFTLANTGAAYPEDYERLNIDASKLMGEEWKDKLK